MFINAANLPVEEEADTKPTEELKTESHRKFRVFITNQLQWDAQRNPIQIQSSMDNRNQLRDESQNIGLHECKFCLYAHQKLFLGMTCLSYLFWHGPVLIRYYNDMDMSIRPSGKSISRLIIIARMNSIAILIHSAPKRLVLQN